jgi:hypothetical protein
MFEETEKSFVLKQLHEICHTTKLILGGTFCMLIELKFAVKCRVSFC